MDVDAVLLDEIENAFGNEPARLVVEVFSLVLPQHRKLDSVNRDEFFFGQVESESGKGVEFNERLAAFPVRTQRPQERCQGVPVTDCHREA